MVYCLFDDHHLYHVSPSLVDPSYGVIILLHTASDTDNEQPDYGNDSERDSPVKEFKYNEPVHGRRKHFYSGEAIGGPGGMPPGIFRDFRHLQIESGANISCNKLILSCSRITICHVDSLYSVFYIEPKFVY